MKLTWVEQGWEDYVYWQTDRRMLKRINAVIRDIQRSPFQGVAKPEPLSRDLKGWWSRRIDEEHRLVYRIVGKDDARALEILQCRYHYVK